MNWHIGGVGPRERADISAGGCSFRARDRDPLAGRLIGAAPKWSPDWNPGRDLREFARGQCGSHGWRVGGQDVQKATNRKSSGVGNGGIILPEGNATSLAWELRRIVSAARNGTFAIIT